MVVGFALLLMMMLRVCWRDSAVVLSIEGRRGRLIIDDRR